MIKHLVASALVTALAATSLLAYAEPTEQPTPTPSGSAEPEIPPGVSPTPGVSPAPSVSPTPDPTPSAQPSTPPKSETPPDEPETSEPAPTDSSHLDPGQIELPQLPTPTSTADIATALPIPTEPAEQTAQDVNQPRSANLPRHGAIRIGSARQIGHGWLPLNSYFPGDWDGDGIEDQMMRTRNGDLYLYKGRRDGSLVTFGRIGVGWNNAIELLGRADFNGDGIGDIVARFTTGELRLYPGTGTGGFRGSKLIGTGWENFVNITLSRVGKGTKPSILGLHSSGSLLYYPTDGKGAFLKSHVVGHNVHGFTRIFAVDDWDGNGFSDLIGSDDSGRLIFVPFDATGRSSGAFMIGSGWGNFPQLGPVRVTGRSAGLIGVRQDGKLFHYQVRVTPPRFSAAVRPVTAQELGKSWRAGCPVGPEKLSAIAMTHWNAEGGVSTGELVVRSDLVERTISIFRAGFDARFPITKIRPAADYGGDDIAMMADDDTSGFNCRKVVGNPYRVSPHSYGYAIDINTVKNPYAVGGRWYPSAQYSTNRSASIAGMHMPETVFPIQFRAHGGHWGNCYRDYHHFELTTKRC